MLRKASRLEVECSFEIGTFECFSPPLGPNIGFDKKWRGSNDGLHHCASAKVQTGKLQWSIELQSKDASGSLNLLIWTPGLSTH